MTNKSHGEYAVVYDGSSVTSPKNWNNPHPGDPCYALHTDSRNYVVIRHDEHTPEILVLNDQGGGVMNVSNIPSTLRAQMKHHEPIVCFELGILNSDGSSACYEG